MISGGRSCDKEDRRVGLELNCLEMGEKGGGGLDIV